MAHPGWGKAARVVFSIQRAPTHLSLTMPSRSDPLSPALEAVIGRSAATVRRMGARHGLSEADIDELFQEVRIRLWKALASGERIGGASASYVYRTARSAALDMIRRRRSRPEEELDSARETTRMASTAAGPQERVEERELAQRIAEAVEGLIDSRRPVVRMYLSGYGTQEIADVLGWTEAKARNLVYRGLADLRARLAELGIGSREIG